MVTWTVVARDAGAVKTEHDGLIVQADIEVDLIECSREEG
jgi:hypothetical protein